MIKANCRDRFTAADFEFVGHTLSQTERDSVSLVELLTDAEARDAILDHPRLVEAILATGATLRISPQFYFSVLIRHVWKRKGRLLIVRRSCRGSINDVRICELTITIVRS